MPLLDFTPSPTVLYIGLVEHQSHVTTVCLLLGWSRVSSNVLPVIQRERIGYNEMVAVSSPHWQISADPGYWAGMENDSDWTVTYGIGVPDESEEFAAIDAMYGGQVRGGIVVKPDEDTPAHVIQPCTCGIFSCKGHAKANEAKGVEFE